MILSLEEAVEALRKLDADAPRLSNGEILDGSYVVVIHPDHLKNIPQGYNGTLVTAMLGLRLWPTQYVPKFEADGRVWFRFHKPDTMRKFIFSQEGDRLNGETPWH